MNPPTGATTKVAAICERNTMAVSKPRASWLNGIKHSRVKVAAHELIPIKYHLCRLSVRSVNGAQMNRHKFAERPNAVMAAAAATENSCCTNRKGNVTDAKPALIP